MSIPTPRRPLIRIPIPDSIVNNDEDQEQQESVHTQDRGVNTDSVMNEISVLTARVDELEKEVCELKKKEKFNSGYKQ